MKKTLMIACALLAPSVMADGALTLPSTQVYVGTSGTTTEITTSNQPLRWDSTDSGVATSLESWAITFTLTDSRDYGKSHRPGISMSNSSGGANGLGITYRNGKFEFSNAEVTLGTNLNIAATQNHTFTFAYDAVNKIAYLADCDTDAVISYALTDSETFATTLISGTVRSWTNQGYQDYSFGAVTDMSAYAGTAAFAQYVPEPTTATLSLLALAGLAARRRRK